ncbi:unnamed protein product [Discosporangium mesarthrocarpum]
MRLVIVTVPLSGDWITTGTFCLSFLAGDKRLQSTQKERMEIILLGCSQDAGVPQLGCTCKRCNFARGIPGYKDGMVSSLGIRELKQSSEHAEGKVFLIDATPDIDRQLWALQHGTTPGVEKTGSETQPFQLGGILLTHAHAGHYTGLLRLGKEGADMRGVPVYCTQKMASFLRGNEPWSKLLHRGNIIIHELGPGARVALTDRICVTPVAVPHRAELSDTLAFLISVVASLGGEGGESKEDTTRGGSKSQGSQVLYCPDTDTWEGWGRDIQEWCEEVELALLDGTFYSKDELPGRNMQEVCHPLARDTVKRLEGSHAEVVLIHLNHTNPLLTRDSEERAHVQRAGFKVAEYVISWMFPL